MQKFEIKWDSVTALVLYVDSGIFWASDGSGCGRVIEDFPRWSQGRFGRRFVVDCDDEPWELDTGGDFGVDSVKMFRRGYEMKMFNKTEYGWVPIETMGTLTINEIETEEEN